MNTTRLLPAGIVTLMALCLSAAFSQTENKSPKVTITAPLAGAGFKWDTVIPYAISVSDAEDGNSDYDEISNNEVLLTVKYLPDSSSLKKYLLESSTQSYEPLIRMATSTCLNCHASGSKLIGPSFDLIAQRYPYNVQTIDALSKKVFGGSAGTWSDIPMPPHPQLKIDEIKEMVKWILKNGAAPDRQFVAGTAGAFRTRQRSGDTSGKSIYVLTATYTDHGSKAGTEGSSRKLGRHTVVLRNKE